MNKLVFSTLALLASPSLLARCCNCPHARAHETASVVKEDTRRAVNDFRQGARQTAEAVKEDLNHAKEAVQDSGMWEKTKQKTAQLKDATVEAATNAGKAIKNTAVKVGHNLKEGACDLKEGVCKAKDNA